MVIGLALGLIAGTIRAPFDDLDLYNASSGEGRQLAFERSLLEPISYDGVAYPQWKDLYVVRVEDRAGRGGLRYAVVGQFHEHGAQRAVAHAAGGKPAVRWTEHFFKAPLPY